MEKLVYDINRETEVYCYGAAAIGKIVLKNQTKMNVCGFIDARGQEIGQMCGKMVYSWDNINEIKKDAVIIISVKNVFEHEDIAYELFLAGYTKLIYKPKTVLEGKGNIREKQLSALWDCIVYGGEQEQLTQIPVYENTFEYDFSNRAKICENEESVIAYVPIELIYTNNTTDFWGDINIQALYPHIYFFHFLENKEGGEVEDYLEFCEDSAIKLGDIVITDAWKENVLRNRTMIYEQMSFARDMDFEFFVRNAPSAEWNSKGYFNLTGGKHRASYLAALGYRFLPISLSKIDYNNWVEYEKVKEQMEKITESKIRKLLSPIWHPYFYKFPCEEPVYYKIFQGEILRRVCKMAQKNHRNISVKTNINKECSLYRLMNSSKFIDIIENDEEIDVYIIDDLQTKQTICSNEKCLVITYNNDNSNVIAKYLLKGKRIYLCMR